MRSLVSSPGPMCSSTPIDTNTTVNTTKRQASATKAMPYLSGLDQNQAAHDIEAAMFVSM